MLDWENYRNTEKDACRAETILVVRQTNAIEPRVWVFRYLNRARDRLLEYEIKFDITFIGTTQEQDEYVYGKMSRYS